MTTKLLNYNPYWESAHMGLHDRFREQWIAASREPDMGKRRLIKDDCYDTLESMRKARMTQFRTSADVARKVLRTIVFRAYRLGVEDMIRPLPEPEVFATLEQVRAFFKAKSRAVHWAGQNAKIVHQLVRDNDLRPRPRERGYVMTIAARPGMVEWVPL